MEDRLAKYDVEDRLAKTDPARGRLKKLTASRVDRLKHPPVRLRRRGHAVVQVKARAVPPQHSGQPADVVRVIVGGHDEVQRVDTALLEIVNSGLGRWPSVMEGCLAGGALDQDGIALTDIEEGDAQGRLCPCASHPGEEDPEDEACYYSEMSPFGPFGKRLDQALRYASRSRTPSTKLIARELHIGI